MKKNYILAASLLFASFTSFGQATNGSFENWSGGTPNDWGTLDTGITVTQETNATFVNDGSSSAKIDVTTATQSNTDFRTTASVESGKTYQISVMIYQVSGDNDARARLYADGYRTYSDPSIVDQWQEVTYDYEATTTGSIDVGLRFYDVSGFDGSTIIYADNLTVVDKSTLSTQDIQIKGFSAYPNPVSGDQLFINSASADAKNVSIYNILGKEVLNTKVSGTREAIDVANLNSGVYLLRVNENGKTATKKLVIK